MPGPILPVRDAVHAIGQWLATSPSPGEAVVRQAIVLRLLQAAGFDIWNPAEVVPEEKNGTGKFPDFLIRAGKGKFALEIKGASVVLGAAQFEQAASYAANEKTRWALLTNGRVWVVLDRTHNPAGAFSDHEVLNLNLLQEGDTFAADLATLLDAETWRADAFAGAVAAVQQRQQQRRYEADVQRKKRPIVEEIQAQYGIATFRQAAHLAVTLAKITEAELDVLLQKQASPDPDATQPPVTAAPEIHFTYRILEAEARAIYRPGDGTWTVLAGSTALNRVLGQDGSNAKGIEKRRKKLREGGQLVVKSETLLEYLQDVKYGSASISAVDIAGASRNGWTCWKDAEGRLAQHYHPENQSA